MESKQLIAMVKGKLEELDGVLEGMERRAMDQSHDSMEAEQHRLVLVDVLEELQRHIDELQALSGNDSVGEATLQSMNDGLADLQESLYGAN